MHLVCLSSVKTSSRHCWWKVGIAAWDLSKELVTDLLLLCNIDIVFFFELNQDLVLVSMDSIFIFKPSMFVNSHVPAEFRVQKVFIIRLDLCFSRDKSVYFSMDNDFLLVKFKTWRLVCQRVLGFLEIRRIQNLRWFQRQQTNFEDRKILEEPQKRDAVQKEVWFDSNL